MPGKLAAGKYDQTKDKETMKEPDPYASQNKPQEVRCPGCGALHDAEESCIICDTINRVFALWSARKGRGSFIVNSVPEGDR